MTAFTKIDKNVKNKVDIERIIFFGVAIEER